MGLVLGKDPWYLQVKIACDLTGDIGLDIIQQVLIRDFLWAVRAGKLALDTNQIKQAGHLTSRYLSRSASLRMTEMPFASATRNSSWAPLLLSQPGMK
jgi:hypothetical protein